MSTVIVSLIVLAILGFAIRSVWQSMKKGGCSSCPSQSNCQSCEGKTDTKSTLTFLKTPACGLPGYGHPPKH